MKVIYAFILSMSLCLAAHAQDGPIGTLPTTAPVLADLRSALSNRIDVANNGVGIVVGVLTPEGRHYVTHGSIARNSGVRPERDTIFEIGSITKVFTSLLLADMVERGELSLDDPVAKYLPGARIPSYGGRPITLVDLATHTSGFPRDATNLDLSKLNPFASYGPIQLYDFLAGYALTREPGKQYEYSNVGAILLGHVLTVRAGLSYEELLQTRVLKPLGMNNTAVTLSEQQLRDTATGYDGALEPIELWEVDKLVGAGSIRSTAADMLTFAAAQLGLVEHPLKAAMRRMLSITRPGAPSMDLHLGWAETRGGVLFSNGRRGGFSASIAIRPATSRAAVVLSNSTESVDDIALHTVVPEYPLQSFGPPRKAITVSETILASFVGDYEFVPGVSMRITREGTRLFGQLTNQSKVELFAEQETEFFVKVVNAQISFLRDQTGTVNGLVLHQNGAKQPARKLK